LLPRIDGIALPASDIDATPTPVIDKHRVCIPRLAELSRASAVDACRMDLASTHPARLCVPQQRTREPKLASIQPRRASRIAREDAPDRGPLDLSPELDYKQVSVQ